MRICGGMWLFRKLPILQSAHTVVYCRWRSILAKEVCIPWPPKHSAARIMMHASVIGSCDALSYTHPVAVTKNGTCVVPFVSEAFVRSELDLRFYACTSAAMCYNWNDLAMQRGCM